MIIVYGGSFNPPTKAHESIMKHLIETFKPNRFVFLPVGNNYSKPELIAFSNRVDMLKLIAEPFDCIDISEIENNDSYKGTLDALEKLKKQYNDEIYFVIGADNLLDFETWIKYEKLIKTFKFIVIDRGNLDIKSLIEQKFPKQMSQFNQVKMSLREASSLVRKDFYQYEDYLTKSVADYIKKNHLYGV